MSKIELFYFAMKTRCNEKKKLWKLSSVATCNILQLLMVFTTQKLRLIIFFQWAAAHKESSKSDFDMKVAQGFYNIWLIGIQGMNSMKLVIPLHSLCWSIHTKDESKRGSAFAFIFGVN